MPISKSSSPIKGNFRNHWLARYAFALVVVGAAFLFRGQLSQLMGASLPPYIAVYPAVMLSALVGGVGPGLFATVAAALGVDFFILPPQGSLAVATISDAIGLAFFSGMGVFMSVVAGLYHRVRQQAAAYEAEIFQRDRWQTPAQPAQGWLLNVGLIVSLVILAVAGWKSARNLRAVAEADKQEAHTRVVIQELDRFVSALKDAETGQRGYLLTGEEKYLEPYHSALGPVQTYLANLKQLTRDNAAQQQRLAVIEATTLEKTAELNRTIELRRSQGLAAALKVVDTDEGKSLMDQIRKQVADAQNDEDRLLQQGAAARIAEAGKTLKALLAGGVLSFALLITVFLRLKQENVRRTQAEADVRHHRDHLQDMVAARTEELGRSNEQLKKEITEHQRAREDLRQQREWFRVTITSIGDAVLATDTNGRITFLNPVAESLTGWPEKEVLGHPVQNVFHTINEETRAPGEDIVANVLREGHTVALANHTNLVARAGHQIPIEDSAAPIKDSSGTVSGVVLVFHDVTQKRRTQEARARLAAIVESSDDAIISKDLDGTITSWNAGAERLFGYQSADVIDRSIRLLQPPDRQDEEDTIMARLKTGERVDHFETVRLSKDGRSLAVSVTISPIKEGGGRIIGFSKIVRDITVRKQKEEELHKLNRTLKALNDSGEVMMRAASEAGYLDEVCKHVIANCGYAMVWIGFAEDDGARTVRPVAHAGFDEGYLETLKISWGDNERGLGPTGTAIRNGKPRVCRNMLTDPDFEPWRGEALKRGYASSLVLPLLSERKAFGAITIYSRQADPFSEDEIRLLAQLADDVSYCIRSLRAEGQLRLLSTAVESAANGIAITDHNAQILWVNPAFTRLTGYSRAEAVGQTPRILKSGRNSPEFYHEMWNTLLKGEPWHGELINRYKDGSLHYEEMTITPVQAESTEITHFVAIKQDISERKQAQVALQQTAEEVKRSNRDLEQFAYIASHDLQEPLRAVGGYMKLLQLRFPQNMDAKAIEYINGAVEGAGRMERLISDLLAFSRVGAGSGSFSPADLNAILDEALHNLQTSIHGAQAKVTCDELPTLPVDGTQVMQLFQNLIANAIKFRSDRRPEIHVGAQKQPDRWLLSVRDNGIGIEPQYFERIFRIFQRLHTRKHYPGTGIGLAICKKIVERHGGIIWVESEPGHSSTFYFSLPATTPIEKPDL